MTTEQKTSKPLNYALWTVQIFLAVIFGWAGSMKILKPGELPWPWVTDHPRLVTITGVFDLMAAVGLIFPLLPHIQPRLTVYAAYGTILLMIAASIFHISRGEGSQIGFNIGVLACATFIAWGRQRR